jgi:hypothetical protein
LGKLVLSIWIQFLCHLLLALHGIWCSMHIFCRQELNVPCMCDASELSMTKFGGNVELRQ